MGARPTPLALRKPKLDPLTVDRLRGKIQGGQLITRLQNFALGTPIMEPDGHGGFRIMVQLEGETTRKPGMTKEQIVAAKALLDKLLPTPQSIAVTSEETKVFVLRAPEPAKDAAEWLKDYGPKTIEG